MRRRKNKAGEVGREGLGAVLGSVVREGPLIKQMYWECGFLKSRLSQLIDQSVQRSWDSRGLAGERKVEEVSVAAAESGRGECWEMRSESLSGRHITQGPTNHGENSGYGSEWAGSLLRRFCADSEQNMIYSKFQKTQSDSCVRINRCQCGQGRNKEVSWGHCNNPGKNRWILY